jgi:hypothetical protein
MLTIRDPYPIHRMFGRRAAAGRAGEAGGTAPAGVPRRATRLPGSGQEARDVGVIAGEHGFDPPSLNGAAGST